MTFFNVFRLKQLTAMWLLLHSLFTFGDERPFNEFNLRNLRIHFNTPAARPLAMGGAAIAFPNDPTAVTINPAGLTFFNRTAISSSTLLGSRTYETPSFRKGTSGIIPEDSLAAKSDFFWDQTLYVSTFRLKGFYFSLFRETVFHIEIPSIVSFNPFQEGLTFEQQLPSREVELESSLVENGLSIAFRKEKISFGMSLKLSRLEYSLVERQYLSTEPNELQNFKVDGLKRENLYLTQTVDEPDKHRKYILGTQFGFLATLSDNFYVGFNASFRPRYLLKSRTRFEEFQFDDTLAVFSQRDDLLQEIPFNVPNSFGAGFAIIPRENLTFTADIIYLNYSELLPTQENDSLALLKLVQNTSAPEDAAALTISDQLAFRIGLEYIIRDKATKKRMPLRIGYYLEPGNIVHVDKEVVAAEYLRKSFPAQKADHHLTAGVGFFSGPKNKIRFDVGADLSLSLNSILFVGSTVFEF